MNSKEFKTLLSYFKPNNRRQRQLLLSASLATILIAGVNSLLGWLTPLASWNWAHHILATLTQWTSYATTLSFILLVMVIAGIFARNSVLGELRSLYSDDFKDWLERRNFYIIDRHSHVKYPKVILAPYGFKIDTLGDFRDGLLNSVDDLSDFLAIHKSDARVTRSSGKDGFVRFTVKTDFRKEQLHD